MLRCPILRKRNAKYKTEPLVNSMNMTENNKLDLSMPARRGLFGMLVISTMTGMLWLMASALSVNQLSIGDIALLILFFFTLPWTVIGFWNSAIGFLIWRFARDPLATVMPIERNIDPNAPLSSSTAILLCIRNENPERFIRNLTPLLQGLDAPGIGSHIHLYVLSDTTDENIAAQEQASFDHLAKTWHARIAITYRRRTDNAGYKAGNIADFCQRWGSQHDFALTLDADSFMTGRAILKLVRMMQANPKLGLLQGLVVGLPTTSGFTRMFQFGMRLGMRSYTIGSAWWQGEYGPYWGHNAVFRLAPFIADCELPLLRNRDGSTQHILSHDQVEAVLMRRAGFDVRVFPQEDESWEENPPTLIEYIRRDLRWCEGNLQYLQLLNMPGIKLLSRLQLLNAVFMFLGSPAWIGLLSLGTVMLAISATPDAFIHHTSGLVLFWVTIFMWYGPKLAGGLDVIIRKDQRRAFGGGVRFLTGFTLEIAFSILMTPITWLNHTMFMIGLLFGKKSGWTAQTREDHSVPLGIAVKQFWPHTVLGVFLLSLLYVTHPAYLPYACIAMIGLVVSIPLAVLTSLPCFGHILMRFGLFNLPEEVVRPEALAPLNLAAYQAHRK